MVEVMVTRNILYETNAEKKKVPVVPRKCYLQIQYV